MEITYSIVIPAYNEETRLGATLARTLGYFADRQESPVELLVVDDGSNDDTADLTESWQERSQHIRVLKHDKNKGKGWAVRTGMLAAAGEFVLFMDADGSTDIAEIEKLAAALDDGADIAIGSRDIAGSDIQKHQPMAREAIGKLFNRVVQVLAVPGIGDTQCGFKLFRKSVVAPLFNRQTVRGWAFDVEILFLAQKLQFKIAEVPVQWADFPGSKVRPLRDALQTVWEVVRLRFVHRSLAHRSTSYSSDYRCD